MNIYVYAFLPYYLSAAYPLWHSRQILLIGGSMNNNLAILEDYKIRRVYDESKETWYFASCRYHSSVDSTSPIFRKPESTGIS